MALSLACKSIYVYNMYLYGYLCKILARFKRAIKMAEQDKDIRRALVDLSWSTNLTIMYLPIKKQWLHTTWRVSKKTRQNRKSISKWIPSRWKNWGGDFRVGRNDQSQGRRLWIAGLGRVPQALQNYHHAAAAENAWNSERDEGCKAGPCGVRWQAKDLLKLLAEVVEAFRDGNEQMNWYKMIVKLV